MRFAREGRPFIGAVGALAAGAWAVSWSLGHPVWAIVLAALLLLLTAFVAYFFRDPRRTIPGDAELVVSPADGKVLEVLDVEEADVFGGPARRITIFLSVFDVHVQRAPVEGDVVYRDYHAGGYAVAWHPKASDENERASVGIRTDRGPVKVTQIAGLIARRIVTYPKEGDTLERGRHIGLIRFGSRVDLFVPTHWDITCAPGDRVAGGETVLARTAPLPGSGSAVDTATSREA